MCKYCELLGNNYHPGCEVVADSLPFDEKVVDQESFATDHFEVSCRFRKLEDEGTTICIDAGFGSTIDIFVQYCPFCGNSLK